MNFLFNNLQQPYPQLKNSRLYPVNNTQNEQTYPRVFTPFTFNYLTLPSRPVLNHSTQSNSIIYNDPPKNENNMTWGKPTWFLFHTLAEKVIESHFLEIRAKLLDCIYSICSNLPCPKCAEHAKNHLNSINFNTIRTKEDLILLLFDFHNLVNSRKEQPIFKYEELEKYKTAITKNIINNFLIEYNKKSKNIRYLSDDLHRERISVSLKKWFSENYQHFEN